MPKPAPTVFNLSQFPQVICGCGCVGQKSQMQEHSFEIAKSMESQIHSAAMMEWRGCKWERWWKSDGK